MAKLGRQWSVVNLSVLAFWLLVSLIQSQEVYAGGKKVSGTGKPVTILSQTKAFAEDTQKHQFTLTSRLDMINSADPDWNNVRVKHVSISDTIAGTGPHRGSRTHLHPGGDKTFIAHEGMTTTVPKPGEFPNITFEGKWRFTGGTGKFKGVTGGGTYKGKVTKAGATYEWEGEYELAM